LDVFGADSSGMPPDAWCDWHRAFKMIELENQLLNHRLTLLLALQGVLFSGFFVLAIGLASLQNIEHRPLILIMLVLVAFVGIASSLMINNGVIAALWQIGAAALWLERRSKVETRATTKDFPPIVGHRLVNAKDGMDSKEIARIRDHGALSVGVHLFPSLLAWVWVCAALMTAWFFYTGTSTGPAPKQPVHTKNGFNGVFCIVGKTKGTFYFSRAHS
jgi:hypothetical protein